MRIITFSEGREFQAATNRCKKGSGVGSVLSPIASGVLTAMAGAAEGGPCIGAYCDPFDVPVEAALKWVRLGRNGELAA